MGEEKIFNEKIKTFKEYKINKKIMNYANNHAKFMHCLPAHRGIEVDNDVIDSNNSLIYLQAKNRMIISKGVFSTILKY